MINQYKLYFVENNKKAFCFIDRLKDLKQFLKDRNISIYSIHQYKEDKHILKEDRGFKEFINNQFKEEQIKVNLNNLESIKQAEHKKALLENRGFNLKDTQAIGYDKFILTYGKSEGLGND